MTQRPNPLQVATRAVQQTWTTLTTRAGAVKNKTLALIGRWYHDARWLIDSSWVGLIKEGYGRNAVVYSCINVLAQGIAEAPLKAYTGKRSDKQELDEDHPLLQLMAAPNELMTEFEFWELVTIHNAVVGRSVWWKERSNSGGILNLWPLRPDRVGPIYSTSDKEGERVLLGWSYQASGETTPIALRRADCVSFNRPDPDGESGGIVEGLGALSVLSKTIGADNKATDHVGQLMANHAQPTVAIILKGKVPDETTASLIKAKFRQEFGGDNIGTPALLDAESDIKLLGFSLRDLEFPELRDNAEARICSAFGVPAVLAGVHVGLKESNQRATTKELREYFTETTLSMHWRRYAEQITKELAYEFGEGIWCEFDTSDVKALAGQFAEKLVPFKEAFDKSALTRNEYRNKLGLEPFPPELGDVVILPNNMTEIPVTEEARAILDQRKQENMARQQQMVQQMSGQRETEPEDEESEQPENEPAQKAIKAIEDWRTEAERRLQQALEVLFAKLAKDAVQRIRRGEVFTETELATAFAATIEPQLVEAATAEGIRIAAEVGVQFDPAIVNEAASSWAQQYAATEVKLINERTRNVIRDIVAKFTETPGMTIGEIEKMLMDIPGAAFSRQRAEAIAISEITDAYSAATNIYQEQLAIEGIETERIWHTAADELVCPQCGPLNGQPESRWEVVSPGTPKTGPKRHVKCRCSTTLRVKKAS